MRKIKFKAIGRCAMCRSRYFSKSGKKMTKDEICIGDKCSKLIKWCDSYFVFKPWNLYLNFDLLPHIVDIYKMKGCQIKGESYSYCAIDEEYA